MYNLNFEVQYYLFRLVGASFFSIYRFKPILLLTITSWLCSYRLSVSGPACAFKLLSRLFRQVMADVPTTNSFSTLSFHLSYPASASPFGPRLGRASLKRNNDSPAVEIDTPGLLTTTSRGVIPHLSRDHHRFTEAIRWVLIPFETL
jgi:hypothetical protein